MAPGDSQEEDRDPILKHRDLDSAHHHVNLEEGNAAQPTPSLQPCEILSREPAGACLASCETINTWF